MPILFFIFFNNSSSAIFVFMRIIFLFLFALFLHAETIGIFTGKIQGVKPWDPESIESGITGSEEAVIYMSQSLAKIGYQVIVIGNPPKSSSYKSPQANPRYIDNTTQLPPLDIAISWRMPEAAKSLRRVASKVYLWPHDVCFQKINEDKIDAFDDVLWLSNAQRNQWIQVNPKFSKFKKIFGNGIVKEQFSPVEERKNPYACIYSSNYARGLDILLDIWPRIKKLFPKATLDIYYGWQSWLRPPLEKELKMRSQIEELKALDVHEHGLVGHVELNKAYANASFWTYPCTQFETFCITALKAQLSGAIPVVLKNSALNETVRYGYQTNQAEEYFETLKTAMENAEKISLEERKNMGQFILKQFTWDAIALQWKDLFQK